MTWLPVWLSLTWTVVEVRWAPPSRAWSSHTGGGAPSVLPLWRGSPVPGLQRWGPALLYSTDPPWRTWCTSWRWSPPETDPAPVAVSSWTSSSSFFNLLGRSSYSFPSLDVQLRLKDMSPTELAEQHIHRITTRLSEISGRSEKSKKNLNKIWDTMRSLIHFNKKFGRHICFHITMLKPCYEDILLQIPPYSKSP